MEDLIARWRQAFDQYSSLKAAGEAAVVRWHWATGEYYSLWPLYHERFQAKKGRIVPERPDDSVYIYYQYGLDAQDRVRVARRYFQYPDPDQSILDFARGEKTRIVHVFNEEFFVYGPQTVEGITYPFFKPKLPTKIVLGTFEEKRLTSYRHFEISVGPQIGDKTPDELLALLRRTQGIGHLEESYIYEGGRLVKIEMTGRTSGEETITYDEKGRVEAIDRRLGDGQQQILFRRKPKNVSFKQIAERVKNRLIEVIPQTVAEAGITEPAYSLVLYYPDRIACPALIFGLEAKRRELLTSPDPFDRHFIWTPAEPFAEIVDPEGEPDRQLFEQQTSMSGDWERGLKLLPQVAAALMRRDWTGILTITPDFVIYAMDYEGDEIEACLRESGVPSALIESFRAKGWL